MSFYSLILIWKNEIINLLEMYEYNCI